MMCLLHSWTLKVFYLNDACQIILSKLAKQSPFDEYDSYPYYEDFCWASLFSLFS